MQNGKLNFTTDAYFAKQLEETKKYLFAVKVKKRIK